MILFKRFINFVFASLAIIFILLAILFATLRLLSPLVSNYKSDVENWATEFLGRPVVIDSLSLSWYRLAPVVQFDNIKLYGDDKTDPAIEVRRLQVGIKLWASLWHRSWELGTLIIQGAEIDFQQDKEGAWLINGLVDWHQPEVDDPGTISALHGVFLALTQQTVYLMDINIHWKNLSNYQLTLKNAEFSALNQGDWHYIQGNADIIQGNEITPILFKLNIPLALNGGYAGIIDFYFNLNNFSLARLFENKAIEGISLESGKLRGELWGRWEENTLRRLQTKVNLNHLAIKEIALNNIFNLRRLSGHFLWQRETNDVWTLSGSDVQIIQEEDRFIPMSFVLKASPQETDDKDFILRFDQFDLRTLNLLTFFHPIIKTFILLPDDFESMRFAGQLNQGWLQWQKSEPSGYFEFEQVACDIGKISGVEGLSGYVEFLPESGQLFLESQSLLLKASQLYTASLPFERLNGHILWQVTQESISISIPAFNLSASDLEALVTGKLVISKKPSSNITTDLLAQIKLPDVKAVNRYYPDVVMLENLLEWLTESIKEGKKINTTWVLRGDLSDFPFSEAPGQGVFSATASLEDVTLDYTPGWPPLFQLNPRLVFADDILSITVAGGKVMDGDILHAKADITHIIGDQPSMLIINGQIEANSANGLALLKEGPLSETLGKEVAGLDLVGPMTLDLDLLFPLDTIPEGMKVKGIANLHANTLKLEDYELSLESLQGQLHFTEKSINTDNIQALMWGRPFSFSLKTIDHEANYQVALDFKGKADIDDVLNYLNVTVPDNWLAGVTDYQGHMLLNSVEDKITAHELSIQSELIGVTSRLPGELAKNAQMPRLLKVNGKFGETFPLAATVNFSDLLQAELHTANSELVEGEIDFRMSDMRGIVQFEKDNAQRWQIDTHWDRLQLGLLKSLSDDPDEKEPPKHFPFLAFNCTQCFYNDYHLGRLSFKVEPENTGFVIKDLALTHPAYQFKASGWWEAAGSKQGTTYVIGELTSRNISALLQVFDIPPIISSDSLQFNIDANWQGLPYQFELAKVSGDFDMAFGRGTIHEINQEAAAKIGVGRILNIFSLRTLPRRLTLDFRDLTSDGFAFDTLSGIFNINQGLLRTNNTFLNGPVAYVAINGTVNLLKKSYDLNVRITPYVTSMLPVVAFFINPLAGAATLAADQVVGKEVGKLADYQYTLKGDWASPQLELIE